MATFEPRSPMTASRNVVAERHIAVDELVEQYRRQLGIEVSRYFTGLRTISLYRCRDTGLRFYHPLGVEGDETFYQGLQHFPWYYLPWKWEHKIARRYVEKHKRVLEIGCGRGDFLARIRQTGAVCRGLELNPDAAGLARSKGLDVTQMSLEHHSRLSSGSYDMVCAFQVLEHVSAVGDFFRACAGMLRIGGTLVLSVPNNESYIRHIRWDVLNMPPHHQGLWDRQSLTAVQSLFQFKLRAIHLEPLQYPHEVAKYYATQLERARSRQDLLGAFARRLPRTLTRQLASLGIRLLRRTIRGDTILAIYTKT